MDSLNFTYWLQGFFEINNKNEGLTAEQVQIIKDHIDLVFNKIIPKYNIQDFTKWPDPPFTC